MSAKEKTFHVFGQTLAALSWDGQGMVYELGDRIASEAHPKEFASSPIRFHSA